MAFIEQKIMEHLKDHPYDKNSVNASWEITQMGIAECVGRTQPGVALILGGLEKDGIVFSELRHVKGKSKRVKAYYLTDKAKKELNKMRKENGGTNRPLVSNEKPSQGFFVGREKELAVFHDWIDSSTSNTLVVRGMAGVGKTIFASRALDLYCADTNILWIDLKPWISLNSILLQIFDYLSILKEKSLSDVITRKNFSIQDITFVLEKELEDLDIVLVFDDYGRHCKKDVKKLIEFLVCTEDLGRNARIVIAGREPPIFIEQDNAQLPITEIAVGCLTDEESLHLLEHEDVAPQFYPEMIKATNGHPLALQLLANFGQKGRGMTGSYLEEAIFSSITPKERNILEITSLLRQPVEKRAMLDISQRIGYDEIGKKTLSKLVNKSFFQITGNKFSIHDLLRSLFTLRISPPREKEQHTKIAQYYEQNQDKDQNNILEAIFHLGKAQEFSRVYMILREQGERIVYRGFWDEIMDSIDSIFDNLEEQEQAYLLLQKARILSGTKGDIVTAISLCQKAKQIMILYDDKEGEAEAYYDLGLSYLNNSMHTEAIENLDKSLEITLSIGREEKLSDLYRLKGSALVQQGRTKKGIGHLEKSLDYYISTNHGEPYRIYQNMTLAHYNTGDIEKGISTLKESLERKDEDLSKRDYLSCCSMMGAGYSILNDGKNAIKWLNIVLPMAEEMGDLRILSQALGNITEVYLKMKDLEMAEHYAKKAVPLCKRVGDIAIYENSLMAYASTLLEKGEFEKSKKEFEKALDLPLEVPNVRGQTLHNYGQLLYKIGQKEDARKTLEQSLEMFVQIKNKLFEQEVKETMRELGL